MRTSVRSAKFERDAEELREVLRELAKEIIRPVAALLSMAYLFEKYGATHSNEVAKLSAEQADALVDALYPKQSSAAE